MGAIEQDPDPGRCWQCGAAADPACEYVQLLNSRPGHHPDAFGEKVKRGRWQDAAWVQVPRCAACQARNDVVMGCCAAAFFIGAIVGGFGFPSAHGWTTLIGAFGLMIPIVVASRLYERWRGYRSLPDYPPLRRLLSNGWSTPN